MNINLDNAAAITAQVDELGQLSAQIADLEARSKSIKDALKEIGDGEYTGTLFRAVVSSSNRETLDMKAVRAKLSPQFITAHTKVTSVTTLKVTAR